MIRKVVVALLAAASVACATIDHGRTQQIRVDSHPAGASVTLSHCGSAVPRRPITPTTVTVSRRATRCELTLALPSGEDTRIIHLHRHLTRDLHQYLTLPLDLCGDSLDGCDSAEAIAADILIWGVVAGVGITVDASTAALFEELPRTVTVDFENRQELEPTRP
jgi:hypothetical protein